MLADLRVAARGLLRSKGFTAAAALTLALGIAATTTIFSVVYGVLLRPLPYRNASRLVVIQGEKDFSTGPRIMNYSPAELEEFAAATSRFSSMALSTVASLVFRNDAGVRPVATATVSGAFFATLGVAPQLGRLVGDEADPFVVISDRFWRSAFDADPDVLGRPLRLTDRENIERAYTIVGVLPAEFQYPRPQTDVWRPLGFVRAMGDDRIRDRNRGGAEFIARLQEGATLSDARADSARANEVLKPQLINSRVDLRSKVTPLPDYVSGTIGPALWILMGAVMLVLLVAVTNVASLILARQSSRSKEISIRLALGSPRLRLILNLIAESGLIALAGCAIGVMMARAAVRVLQYVRPAQLPRLDSIVVDMPVLGFAAAAAAFAAIAAAVYPAVRATRTDALQAMRAGNAGVVRGSMRVRSALVVVEIAASIILLVGATLLSRSLFEMLRSDLGVNTENVMTAQLDIGLGRPMPGPRQIEIMEALRRRVAAIPSVRIAGFGSGLPPATEVLRMSFVLNSADGTGPQSHIVTSVPVSAEYFAALQIHLLRGRLFNDRDTSASTAVGIVNREAARRFFGSDEAVGQTLPYSAGAITIVGVVDNVKYTGIGTPTDGVLYLPFAQQPIRFVALIARTDGDPALIAHNLTQAIRAYDPDISIGGVQPLTSWVADSVAQPRFRTWLLSAIALITFGLAIVGLYGVIAYSASQRVPEIGVRMAIGAEPADITRLVLAGGVKLAAAGIAIGLTGSFWLTRLLNSFLYNVSATDPLSFVSAAATLLAVALVATYIPARRAARIDPMTALRTE
jgi:predicted permease